TLVCFFFQAEDGIRDFHVTGVQTCALPILSEAGTFGETEQLLSKLLAAEYAAQLAGGVPMTQVETIRPGDFGIEPPPVTLRVTQIGRASCRERVSISVVRGR